MQKEMYSVLERIVERRRKPRYQGSFPALIQGTDESGWKFEEEALLENISASGLYFSTKRFFSPEQSVSVVIQLGDSQSNVEIPKTYLETDGMIIRVDYLGEEQYGVAVEIQRYNFL